MNNQNNTHSAPSDLQALRDEPRLDAIRLTSSKPTANCEASRRGTPTALLRVWFSGRAGAAVVVAAFAAYAQVKIPNRPAQPLFKGEQGRQHTEIHFDPATRTVTLKLQVQDPSGYFIPNIPRDSFVIYEDGVRQKIVSADVERAPASMVLLMEHGSPYPDLSGLDAGLILAGRQLLDRLDREDQVAIFQYGDKITTLTDFTHPHDLLDDVFYSVHQPASSQTKLFDALVFAAKRIRPVVGRKGIILFSSGVDTFSNATFTDALSSVQECGAPLYAIGLSNVIQDAAKLAPPERPFAKVDWQASNDRLMKIARESGGRAYFPPDMVSLSPSFNDILENLKVRYVFTYKSSSPAPSTAPRQIRVDLVDPDTGGPLQIVDTNGNKIVAKVVVEGSYTPTDSVTKNIQERR